MVGNTGNIFLLLAFFSDYDNGIWDVYSLHGRIRGKYSLFTMAKSGVDAMDIENIYFSVVHRVELFIRLLQI